MSEQEKKKDITMDILSWAGTVCMMCSPYLLSYPIGYVFGAIGVALITPPCYKNKQWNLVLLNLSSFMGYSLQFFELI